jgi:hypothetical protein
VADLQGGRWAGCGPGRATAGGPGALAAAARLLLDLHLTRAWLAAFTQQRVIGYGVSAAATLAGAPGLGRA